MRGIHLSCHSSDENKVVFFVLGLLETQEDAEIRSHLIAGCPVCCADLKESADFFELFGLRNRPSKVTEPSEHLRERILAIATPGLGFKAFSRRARSIAAGTVVVLLILASLARDVRHYLARNHVPKETPSALVENAPKP